jgi:hypothetical protein
VSDLWERVDRLVDRAVDAPPADLEAHGIHLLAARRLRALGRPVPAELVASERAAVLRELAVPPLLARVRAAVDGPIVLFKGPEVAARYPDPALRGYGDIDLLVRAPQAAQLALLDAGFVVVDDYEFPHQQLPLRWPGLPLLLEVHNRPSWLRWMTPPSNEELFRIAVPSAVETAGLLTLPPAEHGLLLAAHSWRHAPLRRLVDLVDVAAMTDGLDPSVLAALARRWGLSSVWATTTRAAESLLDASPGVSWSVRLWARHLHDVRDRTVAEKHAVVWMGAFWAPTPLGKLAALASAMAEDVRPLGGESWALKTARTARAVRDAFTPWSRRDRRGARRKRDEEHQR